MSEEQTRGRYKIVIGIDFEQTGDEALAESLRIAREHPNDELHAVHVVKLTGDKHSARELDKVSDAMQVAGKKLQDRVLNVCEGLYPGEEWEQDVVFHVRVGEPAEALHQVAVDYDAHLVVVGTHARRGIEKLFLGSVAEKLMKIAHLPVLVARPRELDGLHKSDKADARREGETLHDEHYHVSGRLSFGKGGGHIGGLI